jgi:hypothetical protein
LIDGLIAAILFAAPFDWLLRLTTPALITCFSEYLLLGLIDKIDWC